MCIGSRQAWPLLFLLAISAAWCQEFPKTNAESLSGQQLTIPDSFKGHVSLVVVGFSKSSQNDLRAWDMAARKQLGDGVDVYQVAVLEDAPGFVRGMIKHAMKGSTPAERQSHFLVVVKGEADLKKAAAYSEPDAAYLFLLDGSGKIRCQRHGAVNDRALKELNDSVQGLK